MSPKEVSYLADSYYYDYRERWEQHRTIVYSLLAPHSKKINSPQDVMKFEWDKKTKNNNDVANMSSEEIKEVKQRILQRFNIKK